MSSKPSSCSQESTSGVTSNSALISDDELSAAMAFAQEISEQPPNAVINTKALLKSSAHEALNQVMRAEGELFRMATESDEAQIAFMNFLTKKSKVK